MIFGNAIIDKTFGKKRSAATNGWNIQPWPGFEGKKAKTAITVGAFSSIVSLCIFRGE